jgi:hypothetical protein
LHEESAEVDDEVVELGDPYKIDYALLPEAPAESKRELSPVGTPPTFVESG